MATSFVHEWTYDAPLEDVFAMLCDEAYREAVIQRQATVVRYSIDLEPGDDELTARIVQVQSSQGLPAVATTVVGDEIEIVQSEHWTSPDRADLTVTVPGKPAQLTGTITLSESDGVTTERIHGQIKVSIPLLGGKLEGLIGDLFHLALEAEEQAGRAYLSS